MFRISALSVLSLLAAVLAVLGAAAGAAAQLCQPAWSPEFGPGDPVENVRAQVSTVEGGQPVLYIGEARGVWRWDGQEWVQIGATPTFSGGGVYALAVYDDGSGPALYAGGNFTSISGVPALNIAKWDGQAWSQVGVGLRGPQFAPLSTPMVRALLVFDSGSGPELVAGGGFTLTGDGLPVSRVARWNGTQWSPLGGGISGISANPPTSVNALATYSPSGGTPALYATGAFTDAGGASVNGIARWDGAAWSALPGGSLIGTVPEGRALAVYDDGSGPKLYIGGSFSGGGTVSSTNLVRWTGLAYSVIPSPPGTQGMGGQVSGLLAVQGGALDGLYVAGSFVRAGNVTTRGVARYNAAGWSGLGQGLGTTSNDLRNEAFSLALHDDGRGLAVFVGGNFVVVDGLSVNNCARWTGAEWTAVGSEYRGLRGVGTLRAVESGPYRGLYVLGAGGIGPVLSYKSPLRWDGEEWTVLPLPASPPDRWLSHAVAAFDDGGGEALYVAWTYGPQGWEHGRISRWDGAAWTTVGTFEGIGGTVGVGDMAVYDDGSGPALYVTGRFASVDGVPARNIARWTGSAWEALGEGLEGADPEGLGPHGLRLGVRDGALYVAGAFAVAGGVPASCVARWDGAWSAAAPGTLRQVCDMAVLGPEASPASTVLVGFSIFPHPVRHPTQQGWADFGGTSPVMPYTLATFDDGYGEQAYVSGWGGATFLVRWSGSAWETAAGGLSNVALSMAVFDDDGPGPTPPALWCLGGMVTAGGVPSVGIARLDGCPSACRGDWDRNGAITSSDISAFLSHWLSEAENPASGFAADLNRNGMADSSDIAAFLSAWLAAVQGGC